MIRIRKAGAMVITILGAASGAATAQGVPASQSESVSRVVATVQRFHDLMTAGDSAGVEHLLAPDCVVVESGSIETRAEYLAHHLGADIGFAKSVPATREVKSAKVDGAAAWIVSTSAASGKMGERQIDSRGAELMVLSRSDTTWLIRAIHWSTRPRRGGT